MRGPSQTMNLETKWLEDFVTLAATRSFSQAAERRFVTQPAFSRRIRSLESALGLTLVNRARTPVELTESGQLFLVTARSLVEQLGEVVRHLHRVEGQQGEVLQFAAAHSLALGFFPQWIARLRHEGLNIASRLVATNVGDAVHALREGGCDLILAFYDPDAALQLDPEIFPSLHLGSSEMQPVCAVDAGGRPLFDLDSGQSVPLLAYSAGAFLGRSVNALLRQRALRSTTVYETAMADSLKSMALQGLGVAWVPRLSISAELARGELAICGGASWQIPLEIRLYRCALQRKAAVRLLWRKLEGGLGAEA
ncbi:HTH-type transcriptional regulator YjiE [compost metagenome]